MSDELTETEYDESLPDGTLFLRIIDRERGEYRLFSCNSDGEMKHMRNFDDLESAKTCADLLDLSRN